MKKIFVAIALIAGLGTSSVAFANAKTTNEISIQLNVADYTPIEVKDLRNVVAFGTSEGTAEFTGFHVAQIWARDNVKISIKASGYAYITVDIADRAEVEITASDAARVSVFLHGGNYTGSTTDNARIKVIDKRN